MVSTTDSVLKTYFKIGPSYFELITCDQFFLSFFVNMFIKARFTFLSLLLKTFKYFHDLNI